MNFPSIRNYWIFRLHYSAFCFTLFLKKINIWLKKCNYLHFSPKTPTTLLCILGIQMQDLVNTPNPSTHCGIKELPPQPPAPSYVSSLPNSHTRALLSHTTLRTGKSRSALLQGEGQQKVDQTMPAGTIRLAQASCPCVGDCWRHRELLKKAEAVTTTISQHPQLQALFFSARQSRGAHLPGQHSLPEKSFLVLSDEAQAIG